MCLLLFPFAGLWRLSTSTLGAATRSTWLATGTSAGPTRTGSLVLLLLFTNEMCMLCRCTSTPHSEVHQIRAQSLSQSTVYLWIWGPIPSHGLRPWSSLMWVSHVLARPAWNVLVNWAYIHAQCRECDHTDIRRRTEWEDTRYCSDQVQGSVGVLAPFIPPSFHAASSPSLPLSLSSAK